MKRRLLIVDDDPTVRTSLAEALADNGRTEVRVADGPHQALAMLAWLLFGPQLVKRRFPIEFVRLEKIRQFRLLS